MSSIDVNVDNFVRAETARMFDGMLLQTGAVNDWLHLRAPVSFDAQTVIRTNRDTLYSVAIVDISDGATLTVPDVGDRYVSVMVVSEDHLINEVIAEPGEHELTVERHGSEYVNLVARFFADPDDAADIAEVGRLQDALVLDAGSSRPYTHPDYDAASLDTTRSHLLALFEGLLDSRRTFGSASEVDPVRHLMGTAFGWGGLPETEAFYIIKASPLPAVHHRITFRDVPVDAFWSMTVYNRDGYLEPSDVGRPSLNGLTAHADEDGSVTIDVVPTDVGAANQLPALDGWNYGIRLYRPRPEILDGRWSVPVPEVVS